ncbi:MAG: hypothetical protein M1820_006737 [Bogoriella megaspora]|nr:MAG: hypothetical protein M1820_006737 [Bogoriella megaspora]
MGTRIRITHSTGSERGASNSEGESSGTGEFISQGSGEEDYEIVEGEEYEDDIEPSDSASRPRTSRRNSRQDIPPVAAGPPRRHHSHTAPRRHATLPHRPLARDPPPRRHPPSDPDSLAYPDEYWEHAPPRVPYPTHPAPEWANIPQYPHSTHPGTMVSHAFGPPGGPFEQRQQLIRTHVDPYGYPTNVNVNPFSAMPPHPFSHAGGSPSEHPAAFIDPGYPPRPPPRHPQAHQRHSLYGEMEMFRYPPYPPYPPHWGHTPPPPQPPPQAAPAPAPTPAPAPATPAPPAPAAPPAAPPPPAEEKTDAKYEALLKLIKDQEMDRIRREDEIRKREEEQAAAKKRAEETAAALKAAANSAKKDAEAKAADEAKKAKDEADKALADAKEAADKALAEAKDAADKATKEAEEQKKVAEAATKPVPQPPIKFKDAVGRKFSFPFHLCKTWKGMENLICQAFQHVDLIGQHVQDGHYDLMGPDGEIILPQVWETVVQPDWSITMHMWPMEEPKKPEPAPLPEGALPPGMTVMDVGPLPAKKSKGKKVGKKPDLHPPPPPAIPVPPAGAGPQGATIYDNLLANAGAGPAHGVTVVGGGGKAKKPQPSGFARWMVGGGKPGQSGKGVKELEVLTKMSTAGTGTGGPHVAHVQRVREPGKRVVVQTGEGWLCEVM